MLNYDSFLRALKKLFVTPHELRHSATEIYYNAGASMEDLRRLLNHSSSKVTQTYVHRTDEGLGAIAGRICEDFLLLEVS